MSKKKIKQGTQTKKIKCLRCNKPAEVPMGYFMCQSCRGIAGNDNVTEVTLKLGK